MSRSPRTLSPLPHLTDQHTRDLTGLLDAAERVESTGRRVPCRGPQAERWISERPEKLQHAADACAGCPLMEPCADLAIQHGELAGVWGGLTPRAREAERRRRRASAALPAFHAEKAAEAAQEAAARRAVRAGRLYTPEEVTP